MRTGRRPLEIGRISRSAARTCEACDFRCRSAAAPLKPNDLLSTYYAVTAFPLPIGSGPIEADA